MHSWESGGVDFDDDNNNITMMMTTATTTAMIMCVDINNNDESKDNKDNDKDKPMMTGQGMEYGVCSDIGYMRGEFMGIKYNNQPDDDAQ